MLLPLVPVAEFGADPEAESVPSTELESDALPPTLAELEVSRDPGPVGSAELGCPVPGIGKPA
ncbi:hypothetical protein CVT26_011843 [Gymnopilus dilepis]|uniref:Uncharacterized protein n=1 Tax=Gymnopilus dilepis TaxID=231916 RepID=A0A409YFZ0_9AGAR|nr:hypothetical protein CVT26_011843 [Gymnopilus dilepis]